MSRTALVLAAQAVFSLHVGVIAFNVFGLVAIPLGGWRRWRFVRIRCWRALHVAALVAVAAQAALGRACFLTIWESDLLARAGRAASYAPLIERWVGAVIYWDFPIWVFAVLYAAVLAYALALWWLVPPCSQMLPEIDGGEAEEERGHRHQAEGDAQRRRR